MTQKQKAAAWDALVRLMEDEDVTIENWSAIRRAVLTTGTSEWAILAAKRHGADFTKELYRGDDPLAALAALTAEAQS